MNLDFKLLHLVSLYYIDQYDKFTKVLSMIMPPKGTPSNQKMRIRFESYFCMFGQKNQKYIKRAVPSKRGAPYVHKWYTKAK